jgi:F0F1-type ATP synthase membrane subunit b/b'
LPARQCLADPAVRAGRVLIPKGLTGLDRYVNLRVSQRFAVPRFLSKMDKTLHDLGGIVLNGLPTFFLVLLLTFCVRYLYLKPLEKVLAERFRLTEGARKAAEESLRTADTKIAEYEKALGEARGEIYREQSEFLRKMHEEQADQVRAARARSDQRVAAIKESLSKEAEAARSGLEAQSDVLATQIADSILHRRVA